MKNNDLILQKLSKSYHGQVVFSDLSLALSPGNAYCLMAPSGTGKTTLFRILMGLETPDSGTIDGLKNLKISAVFQEDRLLPWLTVRQNVEAVLFDDAAAKAAAYLDAVGLTDAADALPHTLSGGMKRRAAIARALAKGGKLLLLDEPFSALDPALRQEMLTLVAEVCRDKQLTLLMVSHSVGDAARIACRSIVVADGRIAWQGKTDELLSGQASASTLLGIKAE